MVTPSNLTWVTCSNTDPAMERFSCGLLTKCTLLPINMALDLDTFKIMLFLLIQSNTFSKSCCNTLVNSKMPLAE